MDTVALSMKDAHYVLCQGARRGEGSKEDTGLGALGASKHMLSSTEAASHMCHGALEL